LILSRAAPINRWISDKGVADLFRGSRLMLVYRIVRASMSLRRISHFEARHGLPYVWMIIEARLGSDTFSRWYSFFLIFSLAAFILDISRGAL
jgi:hypothetical protein